ncbi:MAG: DUF2490 domain-containing protein [Flavobacteriales bacterium]|nr:DUF2490 domain-containing protein [Flavobacteriales bacterium]
MPLHLLLPALLLALPITLAAQRVEDANAHFWFSHWGDHMVHDRWSLHSEFHIRRAELGGSAQQLLIRPAVNFHLHEQVMLTAGYSYYENYRYGAHPIRFANWEHHGFLQFQFSNWINKVRMQHRYRWEHRWMARMSADDADVDGMFIGYGGSDRFRYRVWVTIPIGNNSPWTVNGYNEIFLSLGGTVPGNRFSQNRASGLMGYQVNKELNLLAGYLYQTIDRPAAAAGADVLEQNSTLHVVVVFNLGVRKRNAQVVPLPPQEG